MNEERKMILEMVKAGTVTVDEAERLLAALAEDAKAQNTETGSLEIVSTSEQNGASAPLRPKRIIVCVTKNGKPQVNVRLPFSLVRVGLKMGKTFMSIGARTDEDAARVFDMLRELDLDELLDSISDGDITLPYTVVDVNDEESDEQVRVVLE